MEKERQMCYAETRMNGGMNMVFTPFTIKNIELKNRWIMLAMHTGFAEGNALTERDFAYYEERAKGGAAAEEDSLVAHFFIKLKEPDSAV